VKYPNLFLIGPGRSGTQSLNHYLSQHPDVFMARESEPLYFAADFIRFFKAHDHARYHSYVYDADEYAALFRDAGNVAYAGEKSCYFYSREAAELLRQFNPDARLVITFRHPVDMLHSAHATMVRIGIEPIDDFVTALNTPCAPDEEGRRAYLRFLTDADRADYAGFAQPFLAAFPPEQIKVILFDDLRADPEATFGNLLHFLGLPESESVDFSPIGKNRVHRLRAFRRMLTSPQLRSVTRQIIPKAFHRSVWQAYEALFLREARRASLAADTRKQLSQRYRSQVAAADELFRSAGLIDRSLLALWKM